MFAEYDAWTNDKKVIFLSRLAHELTVYARSTYEPGTTKVLQPELLRSYNEVQHRVTASLHDHLLKKGGMPVSTVLAMLKDFGVNHNCTRYIDSAITNVLRYTLGAHVKVPGQAS